MKNLWDVTGALSRRLDIENCRLYFCPPPVLPPVVTFGLWGVVLHTTESDWPAQRRVDGVGFDTSRESVFIAGISHLRISEPECGDLVVTLYDASGKDFVPTADGRHVRLVREWGGNRSEEAFEYDAGPFLDWPRGNCNVSVYSRGNATFEFDSRDCISLGTYVDNENKYRPPDAELFISLEK